MRPADVDRTLSPTGHQVRKPKTSSLTNSYKLKKPSYDPMETVTRPESQTRKHPHPLGTLWPPPGVDPEQFQSARTLRRIAPRSPAWMLRATGACLGGFFRSMGLRGTWDRFRLGNPFNAGASVVYFEFVPRHRSVHCRLAYIYIYMYMYLYMYIHTHTYP